MNIRRRLIKNRELLKPRKLTLILNKQKRKLTDEELDNGKCQVKQIIQQIKYNDKVTRKLVDNNISPSKNDYAPPYLNENVAFKATLNPSTNKFEKIKDAIAFIYFDDDTIKPVINLDTSKMEIIQNWYKQCNIPIEIENANITIPSEINENDIENLLFQDLNGSMKSEYVNYYLPLAFKQLLSSIQMKKYEDKFGIQIKKFEDKCGIKIETINEDEYTFGITTIGIEKKNNKMNSHNKVHNNLTEHNILIPESLCHDEELKSKSRFGENVEDKCNLMVKKIISIVNENDEVQPYNFTYDVLHSNANANAIDNLEFIDEFNIVNEENNNISINSIMYNLKFNKSLVIKDPSMDELDCIKNNQNYGFINLLNIQTDSDEIGKYIDENFNNVEFISINLLNQKLKVLSETIEYIKLKLKDNLSNEEQKVKTYIQYNFTLNEDLNNRMKLSTLYDNIIKYNIVKHKSFKHRFSKYLQDLGLKKQRHSDGIYYYGICDLHENANKHITMQNWKTEV